VLDGDSLVLRQGRRQVEVRLYGIDAPEYRQRFGGRARRTLGRLVRGQEVEVERMTVDGYGREVALVRRRGVVINEEMVRSGLAWVYQRYCQAEPWCSRWRELEQQAYRERRGLWQDRKPRPPWEFRRQVTGHR